MSKAVGARQYTLSGLLVWRGRLVLAIVFIPMTIILLNSESILTAVGQDKQVAANAQRYITCYLPGMFIQGLCDLQFKYLMQFKKNHLIFVAILISATLHAFWCQLFVIDYKMDIVGTGIANIMSQCVKLALVLIFSACTSQKDM